MTLSKQKILVTGASGQLGLALRAQAVNHREIDFFFVTRSELDITNKEVVQAFLEIHTPDVLINTAAYTAVDKAESEQGAAFLVNETGVENLAMSCKALDIFLIHISTDYVFDGQGNQPYTEKDVVNPQTVYGKSKLAGEKAIIKIAPKMYYIVRTSWLYSKQGRTFYNTMLRLANEGKEISVVNDQWGSPTLSNELAKILIYMAVHRHSSASGVYHYSGEGACTWYAFAKAILEKYHPTHYLLRPVSSHEYPTAAKRPTYSVLDTSLIKKSFGLEIKNWKSVV